MRKLLKHLRNYTFGLSKIGLIASIFIIVPVALLFSFAPGVNTHLVFQIISLVILVISGLTLSFIINRQCNEYRLKDVILIVIYLILGIAYLTFTIMMLVNSKRMNNLFFNYSSLFVIPTILLISLSIHRQNYIALTLSVLYSVFALITLLVA